MNLILSAQNGSELRQRWRQQVASQQRRRLARGSRPLAAVTFHVCEQARDGLVDIRRLSFIVMYDNRWDDGSIAIRCAGCATSSVPWGLKIGGADHAKFEKNLGLAPRPEARGQCFDARNGELLSLALNLDQLLERHCRYPHLRRRTQPRWPKLWAGFSSSVAEQVKLAGPEFEHGRRQTENSTVSMLSRTACGLTLYPLSYVSHAWRQILVIFADLTTIPKRQVIALEPHARNLCGYDGAIEFDLLGSRFTSSDPSRQRNTPRRHMTAMLAS